MVTSARKLVYRPSSIRPPSTLLYCFTGVRSTTGYTVPPSTLKVSTMLLACAGAALPLDAATTARTTVGRAAVGVSARSICTTLRWRLISLAAYLLLHRARRAR